MPTLSKNLKEKLWITGFLLILIGALGFLLYGLDKGVSNQPQIVMASSGDVLFITQNTPFNAGFGLKNDPSQILFQGGLGILTIQLPFQEVNWQRKGDKLVVIHKDTTYTYSILKDNQGKSLGIKEEIILGTLPQNNTFTFPISLKGLTVKKFNGLWHFFNEQDKEEFYIPQPFMVDAKGVRTEKIDINITQDAITIAPDKEWLSDPERVYPVTIDPSFVLTILNVHSHPQAGDNWTVSFETRGTADLIITPDDQNTIDDLDFVFLKCGDEEKIPQILEEDVIFYPNWSCPVTGTVNHLVNVAGKHTLKFQFGDKIVYAYNNPAWLAGWEKRVKLTIDNTDIGAALSDFPILVYLSASSGRNGDDVTFVFDEVGANNLKIAVTKADGVTECKVEIERWDVGEEKAWLWAKIPDVAHDADTDIYLYFDNSHADNTANVGVVGSVPGEAVWNSAYKCVLHLAETAGNYLDSTDQDNDATVSGTVTRTNIQKIGLGADLIGDDDYLEIVTAGLMSGWDEATVEIYANYDSVTIGDQASAASWGGDDDIFILYYDQTGASQHRLLFKTVPSGTVGTYFGTDPAVVDTWYLLGATYERNVDALGWENGTPTSAGGAPDEPLDTVTDKIRHGCAQDLSKDMNGKIDEIRISDVKRSTAWMAATYETGRDDLLDFGSEEAFAVGWLSGWDYRKSHIINSATGAGTNYQVKITVYYGTDTDSGGDVYLNSKCRTDFGDIRFTENDGTTELDYWIESKTDSNNAVFWVKVADDLSSSATTIYIYYGKADATTTSSESTIYVINPSFESEISESDWVFAESGSGYGALDTYWKKVGDYSYRLRVENGPVGEYAQITQTVSITTGNRMFWSGYTRDRYDGGGGNGNDIADAELFIGGDEYFSRQFAQGEGQEWNEEEDISGLSGDVEIKFKIREVSQGGGWFDGRWFYVDRIIIRKYVSPEPTHGSWGSEEAQASTTYEGVKLEGVNIQ